MIDAQSDLILSNYSDILFVKQGASVIGVYEYIPAVPFVEIQGSCEHHRIPGGSANPQES